MNHSSPYVARRQLGRRLRQEREQAGRTIRSVQDAKFFSESKVSRIEAGKVPVRIGDVWTLCRFYETDPEMTDALAALAEETTGDGWWASYVAAVADWYNLYLGLEETCTVLSTYNPVLLHDLLQTEDYARAVLRSDESLDEEVIGARMNVQAKRKSLWLGRPDCRLRVVLGPSALSQVVGSPEVMSEQILHLRTLDAMHQVSVRVLPRSAGAHPGLSGPFTTVEFDDDFELSMVYLESLLGARYLDASYQVDVYRRAFQRLFEQAIPFKEYD